MGTGWFPRCCLWLRGTVAFRGLCNYTTMFRYCIILHSANTIVQRSERVMAQCLESPSHRQTETPFLPVIISSVSKPNPYSHYRSPNHATLARREKKKRNLPLNYSTLLTSLLPTRGAGWKTPREIRFWGRSGVFFEGGFVELGVVEGLGGDQVWTVGF